MKQHYAWIVLLVTLGLAVEAAAQFNPEALKKMQKEGHKIVEQAEAEKNAAGTTKTLPATARSYRHAGGLCLDARGVLSVERCDDSVASQQWTSDQEGRLVAHDGRCLAGGQLAKCGGGNAQTWLHDEQGRLANGAQQCLQVQGKAPKAGARVVAAQCKAAAAQIWS